MDQIEEERSMLSATLDDEVGCSYEKGCLGRAVAQKTVLSWYGFALEGPALLHMLIGVLHLGATLRV